MNVGERRRLKSRSDETNVDLKHVDIVLVHLPHYREGLVRLLESDPRIIVKWILGDSSAPQGAQISQAPRVGLEEHTVVNRFLPRGFVWQSGLIGNAIKTSADVVVITGDPHNLSTWVAGLIYRARGIRLLMWTHGWSRQDDGFIGKVRLAFYNLADGLLLYGDRAVRIGLEAGYRKRMFVIFNSTGAVLAGDRLLSSASPGQVESQHWIIISRLTESKGFDRALRAAALLQEAKRNVRVTVVGDGPELNNLKSIADDLGLDVDFRGAVYDHAVLDALLDSADILMSPVNVGLSAIHAMSRGCPVGTSNDDEKQGPEAEAVVNGSTGIKFDSDSVTSIAYEVWDFVRNSNREEVHKACVAEVRERWTPVSQSSRLVDAVFAVSRRD